MVISMNAKDLYGGLIVAGIMAHIATQVILNIAVVTNTIPNTGIILPFISYGGSSLAVSLGAVGILFNIGHKSAPPKTLVTSAPPKNVDVFGRPRLKRIK